MLITQLNTRIETPLVDCLRLLGAKNHTTQQDATKTAIIEYLNKLPKADRKFLIDNITDADKFIT